MFANEGSNRPYPSTDVRAGHHDVSHHGKDEDKLANYAKINRHHSEQFAYLLDRLAGEKDESGAALHSTLLLYGGAIGDGDRHDHRDLPIIVAGGTKDDALAAAHGTHRELSQDCAALRPLPLVGEADGRPARSIR